MDNNARHRQGVSITTSDRPRKDCATYDRIKESFWERQSKCDNELQEIRNNLIEFWGIIGY
jgi:hypothetical protein